MHRIFIFMKKNYKILLLVTALSAVLWSFMPTQNKVDPEKDKLLLELLTYVLEKGHYSPIAINDEFSKKAFEKYVNGIDPTKRFLLLSDIKDFKKYETSIDDLLKNKDVAFFNMSYERLLQRIDESKAIYKSILAKPMDFTVEETINIDYEKQPYVKTLSELKERWRKQIKLSVLSSIVEKQKLEEEKKTKDADYVVKTFVQLEKETRDSNLKSLNEYFDFVTTELDRNDWFSVYINAIVEQFDPHTFYFSPDDKEKFDISMSGKFEGIGARLQKKNDYIEVTELISGGPAWRGKELEAGDLIIKVGQGNEEPIDIAGMRTDDVVKKIKGPKGTIVKLTVKKVDGTLEVISITRDQVETEETFAKSAIVEKNGKKYGIIYLPKFYIDFDNKEDRDAFKDVALEVERLKEQHVSGIILDLRGNGGGSLETVVNMTGLFIKEGPVVQIKSANKRKEILSDRDPAVQWDGPLVVMVDNYSASASEIFAAAIQDYNRGIVVGSKHTYGKGTVQNVIDLNQFVRGNSLGNLGAIKATTQKFYRVNGGSTQKEGVKSDIVFPDRFAYLDMGERDEKTALTWDKIDPATYKPVVLNFKDVIANSNARIASNEQFKLIDENAKWIFERKDENVFELNIDKYKAEIEVAEVKLKKYKEISKYNNELEFKSLPYEEVVFKKDALLKEKRVRWHEDLQKDIYVNESINIISEMKSQHSSKNGSLTLKR